MATPPRLCDSRAVTSADAEPWDWGVVLQSRCEFSTMWCMTPTEATHDAEERRGPLPVTARDMPGEHATQRVRAATTDVGQEPMVDRRTQRNPYL